MSNTYSMWLGCQVVLHIETRESRVPLRGLVVNESGDVLRFRIDGRWEVDIFKEMIVGVEADNYGALPRLGTQQRGSRRVPLRLNANAQLESCFGPLVVQEFLAPNVLEDPRLRRIGRKYPVCPVLANDCVGTRQLSCPRHLWLSGPRVLRGLLRLWNVAAHLLDYHAIPNCRELVEAVCANSSLVAPALLARLSPD